MRIRKGVYKDSDGDYIHIVDIKDGVVSYYYTNNKNILLKGFENGYMESMSNDYLYRIIRNFPCVSFNYYVEKCK